MHVAAQGGHTDCIKYLIRYKSPLDIQDVSSMTPLHYCGMFIIIVTFLKKTALFYLVLNCMYNGSIWILYGALTFDEVPTPCTFPSLLINVDRPLMWLYVFPKKKRIDYTYYLL